MPQKKTVTYKGIGTVTISQYEKHYTVRQKGQDNFISLPLAFPEEHIPTVLVLSVDAFYVGFDKGYALAKDEIQRFVADL